MACACRLAAPKAKPWDSGRKQDLAGARAARKRRWLGGSDSDSDSDTWAMGVALSISQFQDMCFMSTVGR